HVVFAEPGASVAIVGRMLDGAGQPVGDALIETWQRSPTGEAPAGCKGGNPHGFARLETHKDGTFRIETLMPGGPAPHLDVTILEFESALAAAQGAEARIPADAARAIASACKDIRIDVDALVAEGKRSATLAVPLVRMLRETVGKSHAAHVHFGATSQDVLDTA